MKQAVATSETRLIGQIRALAERSGRPSSIVQSIGDDCAIVRPPPGRDLVFTTDFVLENRHFTLDTHTPAEIGHKALARSLSDLAAMGAKPLFCLVSLALPADLATVFVPRFYRGLLALAKKQSVSLAGGDLARFPNVIVDVMCCGTVKEGKALLRSAAKAGDFIYVTGVLGQSALGFRSKEGVAWTRHRVPTPRLAAGIELGRLGVRCAIDISDGLSLDLARICAESKVSAELTTPLPVAKGATLADALNGGEDYELLFTASPRKRIPNKIAGVRVSRIGRICPQQSWPVKLDGRVLPQEGFDHFA